MTISLFVEKFIRNFVNLKGAWETGTWWVSGVRRRGSLNRNVPSHHLNCQQTAVVSAPFKCLVTDNMEKLNPLAACIPSAAHHQPPIPGLPMGFFFFNALSFAPKESFFLHSLSFRIVMFYLCMIYVFAFASLSGSVPVALLQARLYLCLTVLGHMSINTTCFNLTWSNPC